MAFPCKCINICAGNSLFAPPDSPFVLLQTTGFSHLLDYSQVWLKKVTSMRSIFRRREKSGYQFFSLPCQVARWPSSCGYGSCWLQKQLPHFAPSVPRRDQYPTLLVHGCFAVSVCSLIPAHASVNSSPTELSSSTSGAPSSEKTHLFMSFRDWKAEVHPIILDWVYSEVTLGILILQTPSIPSSSL